MLGASSLVILTAATIPAITSDPAFEDANQPQQEQEDRESSPDDDNEPKLKLGVLKVARSDAAEKWLVRMLLSVESDLQEYVDKNPNEPLVFAIYGRGRAMPPFAGKGITTENLADCAVFLAGACSCMVKDQNPGKDLLIRWNWDKTAELMAADDPEFAGGPWDYQEFSVDEPDEQSGAEESDSGETGSGETDGEEDEPDGTDADDP